MIHDNIYFHNVVEMELTEKGYQLRRLPKDIRLQANDGVQNNVFGTGIELRFKMPGGACDILLASEYLAEAPVACIYFGSIQGGWEYSTKIIYETTTRIHIAYPSDMETLRTISARNNLAFSPDVVRIILPYTNCYYLGIEGEVIPPDASEMPQHRYLAYGSSITHGSLGLLQPYSYPFRIAQSLNCDYINLGFAGCALMEEAIARYIVSRQDWTFASVEMGINALGNKRPITDDEFEKRIDTFTRILSEDKRPVFATSIFQFNGHEQERGAKFREIVEKYAKERLIYTNGLDLMGQEIFVSADLTHPTTEGLDKIASNWGQIMKQYKNFL